MRDNGPGTPNLKVRPSWGFPLDAIWEAHERILSDRSMFHGRADLKRHPAPEALEAFLLGSLRAEESREVVAHLLEGCAICAIQVQPVLEALLNRPELEEAPPAELSKYDGPVDRAVESVILHGAKAKKRKQHTQKVLTLLRKKGLAGVLAFRYDPFSHFQALLLHTRELRHSDPQKMVEVAFHAAWAARRLGAHGFSDEQVADFQAEAQGEWANALRVANRLAEAEATMGKAFQLAAMGTGNLHLWLRLKDLRASLLGTQHRYAEAIESLEEVQALNHLLGDEHGVGRALIKKGLYTGYAGRPEEALRLLDEGRRIGPNHDPDLLRLALHNQALILVQLGRFEEAGLVIERHGAVLESGGPFDRYRLQGLEGLIFAGLGLLDLAEQSFKAAEDGFTEIGVLGHAALASLELATIVMRKGRIVEARDLAAHALQVFTTLQIPDQQLEALCVLAQALQSDLLTAGLLESVVDFLRRSEHDPRARYSPRFS